MRKGQASSEFLIILGMVLIVGLVVVALLVSSNTGSDDQKATASAAYWSSAQPIAIREAHAGPTGESGYVATHGVFTDGFYITLKNTGKEPIIIRSVDMSGSKYNSIWVYSRLLAAIEQSRPGTCGSGGITADCIPFENQHDLCNFPLNPADEVTLSLTPLVDMGDQCSNYPDGPNGEASRNSVLKSVFVPVSIWYEKNGILQLEKGSVSLYLGCDEYWSCNTDADCSARYDCAMGCVNGGCRSGSCTFCPG